MGVHVARIGEMKNTYKILVGIPEWKKPRKTHTCRWKDNIKMDFKQLVGV
jgi:hypothetical protein